MGYQCLCGQEVPKKELKTEFKTARYLVEVRLGERHFFYRNLFRIRYIAYDQIHNLYLRMEHGECGEFLLMEHYIQLRDKTGREYQLRMERPECAREVLEYIKKNHPGIKNEVPGRKKEKKGKEKDGKGNSGSH